MPKTSPLIESLAYSKTCVTPLSNGISTCAYRRLFCGHRVASSLLLSMHYTLLRTDQFMVNVSKVGSIVLGGRSSRLSVAPAIPGSIAFEGGMMMTAITSFDLKLFGIYHHDMYDILGQEFNATEGQGVCLIAS